MNQGHESGFTLLEILVALIVFGFLMAGLSQTASYGMHAWSTETRAANMPQDRAAVDAALRRLIEQAAPLRFAGTPGSLAFTTTLPAGAGLADQLADVGLAVVPGQGLVFMWAPHPAGVPLRPAPPPHADVLLSDVTALRVSFLVPGDNGPPVWTRRWTGGNPPLLVRIGLAFSGGGVWPDIVVAPWPALTDLKLSLFGR